MTSFKISELQENTFLYCRLNNTFIQLISMKEGGKSIEDFRPISLLVEA